MNDHTQPTNASRTRYRLATLLGAGAVYFAAPISLLPLHATGDTGDTAASLVNTANAHPRQRTTYGPIVHLGAGELKTFFTEKRDGTPLALGVVFDDSALTELPTEPSDGRWDVVDMNGTIVMPCCGHEHALEFPANAVAATPFEHAVVNWNPGGHMPPGVYDLPHFDFHFYTISETERLSIALPAAEERCEVATGEFAPVTCEVLNNALEPLTPAQTPPDYFSPGAVEPGMGNHMLYALAPELAGETFTHTWIYGTWKGAVSFFEPMITLEYFESLNGKRCFDYPLPEAFAQADFYPTRYCISRQLAKQSSCRGSRSSSRGGARSGAEVRVTLDRFVWVEAE